MKRLVVACANMCYGGLDRSTGDDSGWRTTVQALDTVQPDIVLVQEMDAHGDPYRLWAHLRRTANTLGMDPVLGPSAAVRSTLGNHTAVLVRSRGGLRIEDQWPPPGAAGPCKPWWAEVSVPGLARRLHAYSVHLNARSAAGQLQAAQELASYAAGQLAVIGGDFNNHPRAGPTLTAAELEALDRPEGRHLLLTRCRRDPGGRWHPDYTVDDLLASAGLADVAAHLPARYRDQAELRATTSDGTRADRCYASQDLADAAASYRHLTIGSDHDAVVCGFDLDLLAAPPAVSGLARMTQPLSRGGPDDGHR